jgi:hypothetical protein
VPTRNCAEGRGIHYESPFFSRLVWIEKRVGENYFLPENLMEGTAPSLSFLAQLLCGEQIKKAL